MELDEIKRYFSPVIYKRGEEYYRSGCVEDLRLKGNYLTSIVRGSAGNSYETRVEMDGKGKIVDMWCDCPYDDTCKHLAATLIRYVKKGLDKTGRHSSAKAKKVKTEINKKKPEKAVKAPRNPIKADHPAQEEIVVKPSLSGEKPGENWNNLFFINTDWIGRRDAEGGDRWKLSFSIEARGSNYGGYNLYLVPVMIFLKKNDEEGRIADCKIDRITERPVPAAAELYHAFFEKNREILPIHDWLGYLLRHPEIPLLVNRGLKALLLPIDRAIIGFEPAGYSSHRKIIYYRPALRLVSGETDKTISMDGKVMEKAFRRNADFCFFGGEGDVFFRKDDIGFAKLMEGFFDNPFDWEQGGCEAFAERAAACFPGLVECSFKAEEVTITRPVPVPVLELDAIISRNRQPAVFFNYNGWVVPQDGLDDARFIKPDSGGSVLASRDREREGMILDYFYKIFTSFLDDYKKKKNDTLSGFMVSTAEFLAEYGQAILDEGFEIRLKKSGGKIRSVRGGVRLTVSSGIDWFDLQASFEDGGGCLPVCAENLKDGFIRIGTDTILVSKEVLEKFRLLAGFGFDETGRLRISRFDLGRIDALYGLTSPESKKTLSGPYDLAQRLKNLKEMEDVPLPSRFNGSLRHYQKAGYDWLHFLYRNGLHGLLADDMGLGKTVQTLAFLLSLKEQGVLKKACVAAPVSTLPNWESEIARFTPALTCVRHHGQGRDREVGAFRNADIILVSYHTLRNDLEVFSGVEWDVLVLDEAQSIKNAESLSYKAVRGLKAGFRLSLTGTPVENRSLELFAHMDFLLPGLLGSRAEFHSRFARPIEEDKNREAAAALRKIVFPFILRRKKEDVAKDLPAKEEIVRYLEMDEPQKAFYERVRAYYAKKVGKTIDERGLERSAITVFEGLLRLRQAALHPGLLGVEGDGAGSCKFDALREIVSEAVQEGHKALVFSQFTTMLKKIEEQIKAEGYDYSYLDGQTKKRDEAIRAFQENPQRKIFLLSLRAGGLGINLTGADYVILYDPWWNPAVERQAVDRAHRIGQKKKVLIYKLIVRGTVEEKILELQNRKRALVDELVAEDSGIFKELSKKDILDLFR